MPTRRLPLDAAHSGCPPRAARAAGSGGRGGGRATATSWSSALELRCPHENASCTSQHPGGHGGAGGCLPTGALPLCADAAPGSRAPSPEALTHLEGSTCRRAGRLRDLWAAGRHEGTRWRRWLPLLSNWPGSDALRLGAAIAAFGPTLSSLRCLLRLSRRIAAPCRMQAAVCASHAAMKAQIHVLGDAGYVWDAQGECTSLGPAACVLLRRLQHA